MSSSISMSGSGIAYEFADGSTLFKNLHFSLGPKTYGLVGPNGVGKTTLLKILAGEIQPTRGNRAVSGSLAVLPQNLHTSSLTSTIEEILGIQTSLDGIGQDWDLAYRVQVIFESLGIGALRLDSPTNQLSGGELVKVHLAKVLLQSPSIVVLDEPSNNLDQEGREVLIHFLRTWNKCMVIVSHDRTLLSHVHSIMELSNQGLQFYGGNYYFYKAEKEKEIQTLEQKVTQAHQDRKKQKRELQESLERQQRRMNQGRKKARAGGIAKIVAGNLKRKAQSTLAKVTRVQEDRINHAHLELLAFRAQTKERNIIQIDIPESIVPIRKKLLEVNEFNFRYETSASFLFSKPITYTLTGPKRIQIVGTNGAGKTTLAKLLMQSIGNEHDEILGEMQGTLHLHTPCVAYLDQKTEILGLGQSTLLQRFTELTPHLTESERRIRLGRFLFNQGAVHKRISYLSGGERMRAALACILFSEIPPELLILDEPTNNLDLDSIERIETALIHFGGAIVVISHDLKFLENMGVSEQLTCE